jgi:hypothetical protein
MQDLQFRREETKRALELKQMEAEFAKAENSLNKSLEKSFADDEGKFLDVRKIVSIKKKHYEEIYKNEPEMLGYALDFLKDWASRHLDRL